jgi:hypothetical protein
MENDFFTAMALHNLWSLGKVVVIWYIFPNLVCLNQEKYGNPG